MILSITIGNPGSFGIGGEIGTATSGGDAGSTIVQLFNFDQVKQIPTNLVQTYTVVGGFGGTVGIDYLDGGNGGYSNTYPGGGGGGVNSGGIGGASPYPSVNGENGYSITAGKSLSGGNGYMTQATGARGYVSPTPSRRVGGGGGGGGGGSSGRAGGFALLANDPSGGSGGGGAGGGGLNETFVGGANGTAGAAGSVKINYNQLVTFYEPVNKKCHNHKNNKNNKCVVRIDLK
jgi:hypothetical protein